MIEKPFNIYHKSIIIQVFILCICTSAALSDSNLLLKEDFENSNFANRGWYDNPRGTVSITEHISGSNSSFECKFLIGGTVCSGGTPARHLFPESVSVYVSYHVKYSTNWQGSNRSYHPHELLLLTNIDGQYHGPSRSHLTLYIEQNEGTPRLQFTDALNIDVNNIGQDLVNISELRAVAGCNGDSDGYGQGDCWACSGGRCNEKTWLATNILFQDTPGSYYKNNWHHIEVFYKLNSISNGKGVADGVIQYWYDGQLVINHNNVMLRTGQYPSMKINQFIIAPYIGDGSPIEQTMWIDNLFVSTSRPTLVPNPPSNLRVQ